MSRPASGVPGSPRLNGDASLAVSVQVGQSAALALLRNGSAPAAIRPVASAATPSARRDMRGSKGVLTAPLEGRLGSAFAPPGAHSSYARQVLTAAEQAERAAAGLHAHWRAQCAYVSGGEVAERDGLLVTATRLPDETLNVAFAPGAVSDPAAALDWFEGWF